jgi:hypothetical protein
MVAVSFIGGGNRSEFLEFVHKKELTAAPNYILE